MPEPYSQPSLRFLMEDVDFETLGDAMYKAPFVCLAHNKFQPGVTDPEFIYANRAALQLWEGKWEEIVGLPSRKSAAEDPAVQQVWGGGMCCATKLHVACT